MVMQSPQVDPQLALLAALVAEMELRDGAARVEEMYVGRQQIWAPGARNVIGHMTPKELAAGEETAARLISAAVLNAHVTGVARLPAGTAAEIIAGTLTELRDWTPAVIKAGIDALDDSRGLHPTFRVDADRIQGWYDATPGGIIQVITGGYVAAAPTDAAKQVYLRSTAGNAIEAGFGNWDTAQRYTLAAGVATASEHGLYRRAQDIVLPVGTMIQWLRMENGWAYVGRIFFGPGGGLPDSGTAAEIIAGLIEDDRLYAPNVLNTAISTLARIQHGNELHTPDMALLTELDTERAVRFQADAAHRIETAANTGETTQHPIHGNVIGGQWSDADAHGMAAPGLDRTINPNFAAQTNFPFPTSNRARHWAPIVDGAKLGLLMAADIGSTHSSYARVDFTDVATTTSTMQDTPAPTWVARHDYFETRHEDILQTAIIGTDMYVLKDLLFTGSFTQFIVACINKDTGALVPSPQRQGTNTRGVTRNTISAPTTGGTATTRDRPRGIAVSGDNAYICYAGGTIRQYNRRTWVAATHLDITLPPGTIISTYRHPSGRLFVHGNFLYILTANGANDVGVLAYNLTTREFSPNDGLTSVGLTSLSLSATLGSQTLWGFRMGTDAIGTYVSLYYNGISPATRLTNRWFSEDWWISYRLARTNLTLFRSDNLPPVVIDGLPALSTNDSEFIQAIYQAFLRGDTEGDGKRIFYNQALNALGMTIDGASLPGMTFSVAPSGDNIDVNWEVVGGVSSPSNRRGSFRLNDVLRSAVDSYLNRLTFTRIGTTNRIRLSAGLVRALGVQAEIDLGWLAAAGITLAASAPPAIAAAGSAGTGDEASRNDHTHAGVQLAGNTETPVNTGTAAVGSATTAAKADHDHGINVTPSGGDGADLSTSVPPAIAAAGSAGTGDEAAREDHTHAGVQLAPNSATPVNTPGTASAGTATTAARADHDHGVTGGQGGVSLTYSTANPVNTPGTPSPGAATAVARADHDHGIETGGGGTTITYSATNPVNTPGAPSPGSGAAVARANHDHGIQSFAGVRRNATLTGTGVNSANALGIAIPLHSTVVRAIADRMRGTTPLAISHNAGANRIDMDVAGLQSQINDLRARLDGLA